MAGKRSERSVICERMLLHYCGVNMSTAAVTRTQSRSSATKAIVAAGLTCGIMDYTAACVTWWLRARVTPVRIGQSISSGLLGPRSFHGGYGTALLGFAIHFLIAFTAATIFYLASRKLRFMTEHFLVAGALYGIAVYTFMYWVVMPLSAVRRGPFSSTSDNPRDRHAYLLCWAAYRHRGQEVRTLALNYHTSELPTEGQTGATSTRNSTRLCLTTSIRPLPYPAGFRAHHRLSRFTRERFLELRHVHYHAVDPVFPR